jgi:hypothetical protein
MPLGLGFYGTNADSTTSDEFCKFCFEAGSYREPNLTLDDMIARSIANMIDDLLMDKEEAVRLATTVIPNLKRWKKT